MMIKCQMKIGFDEVINNIKILSEFTQIVYVNSNQNFTKKKKQIKLKFFYDFFFWARDKHIVNKIK